MKIIELKLNNTQVDILNPKDLGIRLQRFAQSPDNLAIKGADYSTSISLPKTKNNNRFFLNKGLLGSLNKFNAISDYIAEIFVDGQRIIFGTFRLTAINKNDYVGEVKSYAADWIGLLDSLNLNELGYVDGVPTWFTDFNGATSIDSYNSQPIGNQPIVFPTIVYNNTPLIDYFGLTPQEIFGRYDLSDCTQLMPPFDYPNDLPLRNGYFGWRDGLTFEDFPPAIHYKTLLYKCFEEIGWNVKGQIFNEEWFNALIMPFVGSEYKYNYKTLAYLFTDVVEHFESAVSPPFFGDYENYTQVPNVAPTGRLDFHCPNIGYWDDISTRVDSISNFKKYLVTDNTVGTLKGGGYVAPASGKYRIRVKSFYDKELVPDGVGGAASIDTFGNGVANYGWDDNVLVILRRDTDGETVFNYLDIVDNETDFRASVGYWMNQNTNLFIDEPNDVIAYISPKRVDAYGTSDLRAVGSPLSNNESVVNVLSSTHTIVSNTAALKSSNSSCEIEIEIDLEKNERVNFHWISLINNFGASLNSISSSNTQLNNLVSEIEIEYLCGFEDIDIASNLPQISLKQFVSSFINQFNLRFNVFEDSKTVEFVLPDTFYTNTDQSYDITNIVDINSVEMTPLNIPKRYIVGYENDDDDRFLSGENVICDLSTTKDVSNYGNYLITGNDNIYAENVVEVKSIFSATKFTDGFMELMDVSNPGKVLGITANPYPDCNGLPNQINAYWRFYGGENLNYLLPSIQSQSSFDQNTVGELEYEYNYTPRLLYFLGTANNVFGTDVNYKIKIDGRGPNDGAEFFAIQPSVCAFDTENNNPYPSLRYDTYLFDEYFENIVDYYNKSHILKLSIDLNVSDWRFLTPNRLVKFNDIVYRLLEIQDYDPLELNLATITLMKLI